MYSTHAFVTQVVGLLITMVVFFFFCDRVFSSCSSPSPFPDDPNKWALQHFRVATIVALYFLALQEQSVISTPNH